MKPGLPENSAVTPILQRLPVAALSRQMPAWWARVWGLTLFGGVRPEGIPAGVPVSLIETPVLAGPADCCEVWLAAAPLQEGQAGPLRYRYNDLMLYGALEGEDAPPASAAELDETPLQRGTAAAYRQIFSLIDGSGHPCLTRVWNYFPAIFQVEASSERYWQFNAGRQAAFIARQRATTGSVPAACALGNRGRTLSLAFFALAGEALAIENPRQICAYHYPSQYGPKSPTFSRAMQVPGGPLFISGTASIVGHQTLHPDDARAQTLESLNNIEALLAEARHLSPAAMPLSLAALCYRVYVRDPADLEIIQASFVARVGPAAPVLFLLADICRQDLLVEIEASALHPLECPA